MVGYRVRRGVGSRGTIVSGEHGGVNNGTEKCLSVSATNIFRN